MLAYLCRNFGFHDANIQNISVKTNLFLIFLYFYFMDGSKILNKILEYSELNGKNFSEKIGLKRPQAIYDILNGKTQNISAAMANKIISVFPELNKGWLQSGEGSMLKESSTLTAPTDSGTVSIPREAWEVIRSQAASLERKDKQVDEVLAMLRQKIEKGEDADYPGHAATRAAAE